MEQRIVPIAVSVITNDDGEVFLQKRVMPQLPAAHQKWEFPGGKMEYGEDPEQTAVREAKEETNLDIAVIRLLPKIYTTIWPHGQALIMSYQCKVKGGSAALNLLSDKISEAKFFPINEINYNECLPWTKEIINLL